MQFVLESQGVLETKLCVIFFYRGLLGSFYLQLGKNQERRRLKILFRGGRLYSDDIIDQCLEPWTFDVNVHVQTLIDSFQREIIP